MRNLILAALVAGTAATPALAQDVVRDPFTGPRVGAIVGYDNLRPQTDGPSFREGGRSVHGLLYGVDAGFDFDLGGAVVGIEGEYTDSTGRRRTNAPTAASTGLTRVRTGRDLYVGARAGILADPQTLLYVKGGYTNARIRTDAVAGPLAFSDKLRTDGFRLGAGAERSLANNAYVKAEYRYSNYSSAEIDFGNNVTSDDFSVDTDRHQVALGVGVRF